MKIVDKLVEQCREPNGFLGIIMIKIMNVMDVGLTNWALKQIKCVDGKILDIGCGGGKTVNLLAKKFPGSNVFGIDYSQTAVETTIKKNRKTIDKGRMKISQSSVSSMPFADNFFNCITAIRTHYFWTNLQEDIKEVYRILDNKGQLLILSELYKINYHMKAYNTNDALKQLLKDTGFKSVSIHEKNQCICVIAEK